MPGFWIPFGAIFAAEFGDKTMLAVLLLASSAENRLKLWFGAMLGFAVVDGSAILLGSAAGFVLPLQAVKIISGILFLAAGIWMLKPGPQEGEVGAPRLQNPFWLGLTAILTAEWGDKTQIASGLFAVSFPPIQVLAGTLCALGLLTALSVFAGRWIGSKISGAKLQKAAAIVFISMGISFFLF